MNTKHVFLVYVISKIKPRFILQQLAVTQLKINCGVLAIAINMVIYNDIKGYMQNNNRILITGVSLLRI